METERPPRRQLHGYISDDAFEGWYSFAESQRTNVTALMEAAGLLLAEHADQDEAELPPLLRQLGQDAQSVASARSSRRRRPR